MSWTLVRVCCVGPSTTLALGYLWSRSEISSCRPVCGLTGLTPVPKSSSRLREEAWTQAIMLSKTACSGNFRAVVGACQAFRKIVPGGYGVAQPRTGRVRNGVSYEQSSRQRERADVSVVCGSMLPNMISAELPPSYRFQPCQFGFGSVADDLDALSVLLSEEIDQVPTSRKES